MIICTTQTSYADVFGRWVHGCQDSRAEVERTNMTPATSTIRLMEFFGMGDFFGKKGPNVDGTQHEVQDWSLVGVNSVCFFLEIGVCSNNPRKLAYGIWGN